MQARNPDLKEVQETNDVPSPSTSTASNQVGAQQYAWP